MDSPLIDKSTSQFKSRSNGNISPLKYNFVTLFTFSQICSSLFTMLRNEITSIVRLQTSWKENQDSTQIMPILSKAS